MKIKRNKKLKQLLNSKKKLQFGEKRITCFACGAIITESNNGICPNCNTLNKTN